MENELTEKEQSRLAQELVDKIQEQIAFWIKKNELDPQIAMNLLLESLTEFLGIYIAFITNEDTFESTLSFALFNMSANAKSAFAQFGKEN